jgi:hypothetical protein
LANSLDRRIVQEALPELKRFLIGTRVPAKQGVPLMRWRLIQIIPKIPTLNSRDNQDLWIAENYVRTGRASFDLLAIGYMQKNRR